MVETNSGKKQIYGITWLKAFLPLLVIACHARTFGNSASMIIPLTGIPDWKDIVYINILCMAVPLFFVISFYLYLEKRERIQYTSIKLMKHRIAYFAVLFIGWRFVFAIFDVGQFWNSGRGSIRNLYHLFFAGADTLLYYLEQMVYLVVVLELFYIMMEHYNVNKCRWALIGLGFSIALLLFVTYIAPETLKIEALRYFSPVGFIPCIFVAAYFHECKGVEHSKRSISIALVGIVCVIAEWRLLPSEKFLLSGYSMAMPSYARVSVVLFTFAIFAATLKCKKKPGKSLKLMSRVSLYVYCLHQLVINMIGDKISQPLYLYVAVLIITYSLT